MIGELNFFGIFFSPLLLWALIALVLRALLRRLLTALHFYRLVAHRALFDFALFIILWSAVTALSSRFAGAEAPPR